MILWGPPGCGKTTLALLLAQVLRCGVPRDLRGAVRTAGGAPGAGRGAEPRSSRVGARCCSSTRCTASTRRSRMPSCRTSSAARSCSSAPPPKIPSFELNSALLSRCRVHVHGGGVAGRHRRSAAARAGRCRARPGRRWACAFPTNNLALIAQAADGDVRRGLTLLEIAAELAADEGGEITRSDACPGAGRSHAPLRQAGRAVLRPDLGAAQVRAQFQSRMPRCTGWRGCSTAAAIRTTWPAA